MLVILIVFVGVVAIAVAAAAASRRPPGLVARSEELLESIGQRIRRAGQLIGLVATLGGGALLIVAICWPLGRLFGAMTFIDRPTYNWFVDRQPEGWTRLMGYVTNLGGTVNTRAITIGAAACLTLCWRRNRWVPPTVLGAALLLEHFLREFLSQTVHRGHPPGSGGTFPSGGCSRTVALYGLIAYLALRGGDGDHPRWVRVASAIFVTELAFVEGYTRVYLNKHWITDVFGGWIYGLLVLAVMVIAVQVVDRRPAGADGRDSARLSGRKVAAARR